MYDIEMIGVIGSWEVNAEDVKSQLKELNGDIDVFIESIGGSVIEGISIHNSFKEYKGEVTFHIGAVAASIASYIVLSGKKVIAKSNSVYMIHNAWLPAQGDFIALRKAADISEGLSSIIANAYVAKTKMGKSDALSLMAKETFYYGAEMQEAGFVDEVINVDGDIDKTSAYSVTIEGLKACNNAVMEHESINFEAVAKLLPKEEVETPKVVDLSAQQQRARKLDLLNKEIF